VNDALAGRKSPPRPRTWARWIPVTSTGMREIGVSVLAKFYADA
jgi:hypothetical protein